MDYKLIFRLYYAKTYFTLDAKDAGHLYPVCDLSSIQHQVSSIASNTTMRLKLFIIPLAVNLR
jgi:hypothetical protein